MAVEFNHTIVWSRNKAESAASPARILGLPAPANWGPFAIVATSNGVNVEFLEKGGQIAPQHFAFLVSDAEFDQIFGRIQKEGLTYWADPAQTRAGETITTMADAASISRVPMAIYSRRSRGLTAAGAGTPRAARVL